jgi:hypothetical protein
MVKWRYLLLCLVLPAIALVGSAQDTLKDEKATTKVLKELAKRGVKVTAEICVIDHRVYGWFSDETVGEKLYIVDRGTGQNLRTALHELEHKRQHDAGEPYAEGKAYEAEKGR